MWSFPEPQLYYTLLFIFFSDHASHADPPPTRTHRLSGTRLRPPLHHKTPKFFSPPHRPQITQFGAKVFLAQPRPRRREPECDVSGLWDTETRSVQPFAWEQQSTSKLVGLDLPEGLCSLCLPPQSFGTEYRLARPVGLMVLRVASRAESLWAVGCGLRKTKA